LIPMPAMKRLVIASLLASSLAAPPPAAALTIDPFLVFRDVARRPVKTALPREGALADEDYDPCDFGPLPKVLDLLEVVERSLCQDPQVRQAWAQAKYQAAVLGVRQGAYLPTLSATLNAGQQNNTARYAGKFSVLNSDSKPSIYSGGLKMTWVLTDFNMTRSNVRQAGPCSRPPIRRTIPRSRRPSCGRRRRTSTRWRPRRCSMRRAKSKSWRARACWSPRAGSRAGSVR
jgi:outer membrane protein